MRKNFRARHADPRGAMPSQTVPMRIRTVEATDGHDKIQFTCEHCGSESMQDNRRV